MNWLALIGAAILVLAVAIVGAAACSAPKRCRSFENWRIR